MKKTDKYNIIFSPESDKIIRTDENIQTITKTIIDTDSPVEIRRVELKKYWKYRRNTRSYGIYRADFI